MQEESLRKVYGPLKLLRWDRKVPIRMSNASTIRTSQWWILMYLGSVHTYQLFHHFLWSNHVNNIKLDPTDFNSSSYSTKMSLKGYSYLRLLWHTDRIGLIGAGPTFGDWDLENKGHLTSLYSPAAAQNREVADHEWSLRLFQCVPSISEMGIPL